MGFSDLTPEDNSYRDRYDQVIVDIADIEMNAESVVGAVESATEDCVAQETAGKEGNIVAHGDQACDGDGYLIRSAHGGDIRQTPLLSLPKAQEFAQACLSYHYDE